MNHYFKARNKGREDFDDKFGGEWEEYDNKEIPIVFYAGMRGDKSYERHLYYKVKSFLDAYSEEIRLAVIEDVRECALIKVRKTDFGNENSEDIKHNEIIMDFLAKLPSER